MAAGTGSSDRSGAPRPRAPQRRAAFLTLLALLGVSGHISAQGYGSSTGLRLVVEHDEASGLAAGVGLQHIRYGYRRVTWAERLDARALVSVRGGFGGDLVWLRRVSQAGAALRTGLGAARRLRSYRFYGYGNDRPLLEPDRALVRLDEAWLDLGVELPLGSSSTLTVGPSFLYQYAHVHERSPLLVRGAPLGAGRFRQLGIESRLDVQTVDDPLFPRSGVAWIAKASAYAPVLDAPDWFGGIEAEVRGYLPAPLAGALTARVGGGSSWGSVPAHESVFLGGSETLRGHRVGRFAGDASVYGSTELRVPIPGLPAFIPRDIGVFGLLDAGRVFVDGDSPGGWHSARGGGLWYQGRGGALTVAYAAGEERLLHFYLGLPF